MTSERRKSILILVGTLIIGITVGVLAQGLFNKVKRRGRQNVEQGDSRGHDRKSNWFAETITRIVKPDRTQSKKIKGITEHAAAQIDSIESQANVRMSIVLDSVKIQLKPILNDNQWKQLQDFDAKAKSKWHGRRRRGHGRGN
jgi:hypothetical protein